MKNNILLFVGIICLLSCQDQQSNHKEKSLTVEKLTTVSAKKAYLDAIFKADQMYRKGQSADIMLKYGRHSEEFRAFVKKQNEQDAQNLEKIEAYLQQYGHPKRSEVGELAAQTPWAVVHHANNYESRERNFPFLYEGYVDGNIDEDAFEKYLNRMCDMKFGKRLVLSSPYQEVEKIDSLIGLLGLQ